MVEGMVTVLSGWWCRREGRGLGLKTKASCSPSLMTGRHWHAFIERAFCAPYHAGHCVWGKDKNTEVHTTPSFLGLWSVWGKMRPTHVKP